MEPLSIAIISGMAGGAAGQLVVKAWDSGEKWLSTYFKDQHPKAIEKARQNSLQFLADLAQRIHQLEDAAGSSKMIKDRIVSALEDPAFSALLKDALVESATTENKDSHRLLARLVAERLRCGPNELLALTIPLACKVVKSLTSNQLRFLAVATIIDDIFATQITDAESGEIRTFCAEWFDKRIPQIWPKDGISQLDLRHLVGMSCVNLTTRFKIASPVTVLARKLAGTREGPEYGQVYSFLEDHRTGQVLAEFWEEKLSYISLTSSGALIGSCAFEELCGRQSDLQFLWQTG